MPWAASGLIAKDEGAGAALGGAEVADAASAGGAGKQVAAPSELKSLATRTPPGERSTRATRQETQKEAKHETMTSS